MRSGLTPKKITVRGKGGFYQRRYWVLSDLKQSLRLAKIKKEVQQESKLPQKTSQQRLQAWLQEKKVTGDASNVVLLQEFFRGKNGETLFPEDLEKMWKNPEPRTVQQMKFVLDADGKMIRDPNTSEHLVEPVLDSNGKPLTRQLVSKLELAGIEVSHDKVRFNATLIDAGPPREAIGTIMREFVRGINGEMSVSHDLFKIDSRFGGSGIGSEIIKNQLESYAKLGVSRIDVGAAWVGRYTWASMGFEPTDIYKKKLNRDFKDFSEQLLGEQQGSYFKGGVPLLLKPDKTPYTSEELRKIVDFENKPTWQVAGTAIPVWNEATGKEEIRKIGKEFLLHGHTESWEGSLSLSPTSEGYQRIQSYLKINSKEKEVEQLLSDADVALAESHVASQNSDWEKAQRLQNQARGLVETAKEKQNQIDKQVAQRKELQRAYAENNRLQEEKKKKQLQEEVSKLPKTLPEEYQNQSLDRNGLTPINKERLAGVQQLLKDQGISREARTALLAEQNMLYAAGMVAQKKAMLADAEQYQSSEFEKRRIQYELKAVLHAEREYQEAWVQAMQSPLAQITTPSVLIRESEEDEDQARAKRNLQAAQFEVEKAGTPEEKSGARAVYNRIRELKQMEPFDEQEAAEIRQEQIGFEASRKFGIGLQSLARVRKEKTQEEKELIPKGQYQTKSDRELMISNRNQMQSMLQKAKLEVKTEEATIGEGQSERVKEAKKRLLMVKNLLSQLDQSMKKTPDAIEAEQIRNWQKRFLTSEGWPVGLRSLYQKSLQ